MQTLSNQVISLIHYVELTNSGWWEKTKERCILCVFWLLNGPAPLTKIKYEAEKQLGLKIKLGELNDCISELIKKKYIIKLSNNIYKLSEQMIDELTEEANEVEKLESNVQLKFFEKINEVGIDIDIEKLWEKFKEYLFIPIIKDSGAKIYEILFCNEGQKPNFEMDLNSFLHEIPDVSQQLISQAISEFMNPEDEMIRKYFLMSLEAYFAVASSGLSQKALHRLEELREKYLEFYIFVDTNFVFSILKLHNNPLNEAVADLMEIANETTNFQQNVKFNFVIHPITLEETRHAIKLHKERFGNIEYPPNLAKAASKSEFTSGIDMSFLANVASTGVSANAYDYFTFYENGLERILAEKGINRLSSGITIDEYMEFPEVIKDIDNQIDYENKRNKSKAKDERQIKNDVLLWHMIHDMRDSSIKMPLECKYWIVTIDHRFSGFDKYKVTHLNAQSVCLLPAQLIQIMRFFVPRSEQFEKIILSNLRLPLGLNSFDPRYEQLTIKIIRRIATLENISGLPEATITKVLRDESLRIYFDEHRNLTEEDEIKIIENSFVNQINEYAVALENNEKKKNEQNEKIIELENNNKNMIQKITELEGKIESDNEENSKKIIKLQEELKHYTDKNRESEYKREEIKAVLRFSVKSVILIIFFLLPSISLLVWYHSNNNNPSIGFIGIIAITVILSIIMVKILLSFGENDKYLKKMQWFIWLQQKTKIKSILIALITFTQMIISEFLVEIINGYLRVGN